MKKLFLATLLLLLFAVDPDFSSAQTIEYGDVKARLSAGVGVFTYHGPIDLTAPESSSNFTRYNNVGTALLGSFPILEDWLHFRFMLLLTNLDSSRGSDLVGNGENKFLTSNLMLFEPAFVVNLGSLFDSKVVPYLFTGFGGTVADVFGSRRDIIDMPGTGIPGPERSAFHIPFGFGLEVPVTHCVSVFGEASWRFDLNYAYRNEVEYDPHNTSLIIGGVRTCFRDSKTRTISDPPPTVIPPRLIPVPEDRPNGKKKICWLKDLTPVYFSSDSAELSDAEKKQLDDNVIALFLKDRCCATIVGYASSDDRVKSFHLADARAKAVREYLLSAGLSPSRFALRLVAIDENCSLKGLACPSSMFVEIIPSDCSESFE